jgi:general secretion pathway protein D
VSTFDVDLLKGMSVGVFPLKYASIAEVEMPLRLMTPGATAAAAAATSTAGWPRV